MNVQQKINQVTSAINDIEGHLSDREVIMLALTAIAPTAAGQILEIGSFKGKSTILLAQGAMLSDQAKVTAIDPLTAPCSTDPSLDGMTSSAEDFFRNLHARDVADHVDFHQKFSSELKGKWDAPLRLLWIDGDHTYPGVKLDFDIFSPFLADGAIILFHDVLNRFSGPLRLFIEEIVLSQNFGTMGICGSIGWAQYHADKRKSIPHRKNKLKLFKQLSRLLPFFLLDDMGEPRTLSTTDNMAFCFNRARIPHGAISPSHWIAQVSAKI